MSYSNGMFCWHEIGSRNAAASKSFYSGLLNWRPVDNPMPGDPGGTYTMFHVGDGTIAGLYQMSGPEFEGVPSHWMAYVWVDDVAATTAKAESLGGTILMGPATLPGIGSMAQLRDPTGAVFGLFNSGADGHPGAVQPGVIHGSIGWYELATPDPAAATAFYSKLFGWGTTLDNSAGMEYTMFQNGDASVAGMMKMDGPQWEGIPPHWMMYVNVDDCDETARQAAELGGQVHVAPGDIPNVGRFSVMADPAGAAFSVIKFAPMEGGE